MTYCEELRLLMIDKGLFALVAIVGGFIVKSYLQKRNARNSMLQSISSSRIESYKTLWALTEYVSYSRTNELLISDIKTFSESLKKWYYHEGGAMLLSSKASEKYGEAKKVLLKSDSTLREVQDAFSSVRTELKNNLSIYEEKEKSKQTIDPDMLYGDSTINLKEHK